MVSQAAKHMYFCRLSTLCSNKLLVWSLWAGACTAAQKQTAITERDGSLRVQLYTKTMEVAFLPAVPTGSLAV